MIDCKCCLTCAFVRDIPRFGLGCVAKGVEVRSNNVCIFYQESVLIDEP